MKKYFTNCQTLEDLKKAYKTEAKRLHPDVGGDAEEFKVMQAEYEKAFERLKNRHRNKDGEMYESDKETKETARAFMDIIDKVINMQGVIIEVIGSWVWLSGNTMIYKDEIKEAGFWWSKSKKAWYWNGGAKHSRRRGNYTMDQLRSRFGSEEVKSFTPAALPA